MKTRLQTLENNIIQLEKFREKQTIHDITDDKTKEWALRYGLLESIQIMIDISCHLVSEHNLGKAETYAECIRVLGETDIISTEMVNTLTSMAGLRNILIHEYVKIDMNKLYNMLQDLDDLKEFSKIIHRQFVG